MIYKYFSIIVLFAAGMLLGGCGSESVDISQAKYEPKIVVDAYIFPDEKVENIRITRNIPLDRDLDLSSVILRDALVTITELSSQSEYKLTFNEAGQSFEYTGSDLSIASGKTYKLDVTANIDGKALHASSVTTVPLPGLKIISLNSDSLHYREKDQEGIIKKFHLQFNSSENACFYAFSVTALEANVSSFIMDNPFYKPETEDLVKDMDDFRQRQGMLQDIQPGVRKIDYDIEWHMMWFYGAYKLIVYAGDKNFYDFSLTHNSVQETDGNFHAPKMHIDGDGIGVFASALKEIYYLKIIK